jgi:hypothetical protein
MLQPILLAHANGRTALFQRSEHRSQSWFGGPIEDALSGIALPVRPHLIANLHLADLKPVLEVGPIEIPLLYPMRYSGGHMVYSFEHGGILLTELKPREASSDWPYIGYPEILPYHALSVGSVVEESWEQFLDRAPNLPEDQDAELVILVPPPIGLGFTMWGRYGDFEDATLVFECNLAECKVETYNICT